VSNGNDIVERLRELTTGLDTPEAVALIDEVEKAIAFDDSSKARLNSIVQSAVDGIITIDTKGTIKTFNDAAERLFGYTAEEVFGRNVSMLMPEPYHSEHDGYMQRYLETGEAHIIGIGREVVGRRKDGTTFPLDLAVSEFQVDGNTHFTGIVRDITERQEMRRERERLIEQLEDKNAELERFTYTVSHDLKSPLITIKGFLGMLEADAESGNMDRLRKDIERIGSAADKMKELLDEVLELSRIGRVANPSEPIAFGVLVQEVVSLLTGPFDAQGIQVRFEPDMPDVYGDRIRLREVLQNLLENAIKFADDEKDDRWIEIGARREGDTVVCHVADNGIGIDPRYEKKVFGLFDQLDPQRDGTGVGLALVKRIIEVHGGRVWIDSDGLGKGARVSFTLPVPPRSPQREEDEEADDGQ
jgi:PAS domain S-box-containing protein